MNIFELSSTIDMDYFKISSSSGNMASPTRRGSRKGYGKEESSIAGVVKSPPPPNFPIYVDTSYYIEKTI